MTGLRKREGAGAAAGVHCEMTEHFHTHRRQAGEVCVQRKERGCCVWLLKQTVQSKLATEDKQFLQHVSHYISLTLMKSL